MTDRTEALKRMYGGADISVPDIMLKHLEQRTATQIRIPIDPQPDPRYDVKVVIAGIMLTEWDGDEHNGMELNQGYIPSPVTEGYIHSIGPNLFVKVCRVRVKQLWQIDEKESNALGVMGLSVITGAVCYGGPPIELTEDRYWCGTENEDHEGFSDPDDAYGSLWAESYGQELCDENPWVWVIDFEIFDPQSVPECWATFTGQNGYDLQREYARGVLTIGERYRVVGGEEGSSYTDLILEGFDRPFNSVMFEIEGEYPPNFRRWRYPR